MGHRQYYEEPGFNRAAEARLTNMEQLERSLELVHEALQDMEFREAISLAAQLPWHKLDRQQMSHLMDAMISAAANLADGSGDELQAYELAVLIGDTLAQQSGVYRPAVELRVNAALFNQGVVLAQLGRTEDAIIVYDRLVQRAGGSRDLGLRENAVRALFNKGASLASLNRLEEAILAYDELVGRFEADPEPTLSEAVGKALINKGIALAELNRLNEAIAVLDDVVERWGNSPNAQLRRRASRALLNKASALIQLDHRKLALAAYEEILQRFSDDPEPSLREAVSMARLGRDTLETELN